METFRETTPEEAKFIALQFMGQNMGELKELDKRIIGKTQQLQGNNLNVQKILNSIPSSNQQHPSQPQQVQHVQVQQRQPAPLKTIS